MHVKMLKVGQPVYWTSASGKQREGKLVCVLSAEPGVLVEMPSGQVVKIVRYEKLIQA
jgi:hypothetical protein